MPGPVADAWLDIDTLGGAGFASQRHIFGPLPLHLPALSYRGISLSIAPDATSTTPTAHTFTLVLKTTFNPIPPPHHPKTPPSPEPAALSYEASFAQPDGHKSVNIRFGDFKAMYRGKEVGRDDSIYQPLHSEKIYEMSLMCRSGFGQQKGEFGVVVLGVSGWAKEKELGWLEWCMGMVRWVGSWVGLGEGGVRLRDS